MAHTATPRNQSPGNWSTVRFPRSRNWIYSTYLDSIYNELALPAREAVPTLLRSQCSFPNTATPVGVPTNTFPLVIMGVMNLFPGPKWSREPC